MVWARPFKRAIERLLAMLIYKTFQPNQQQQQHKKSIALYTVCCFYAKIWARYRSKFGSQRMNEQTNRREREKEKKTPLMWNIHVWCECSLHDNIAYTKRKIAHFFFGYFFSLSLFIFSVSFWIDEMRKKIIYKENTIWWWGWRWVRFAKRKWKEMMMMIYGSSTTTTTSHWTLCTLKIMCALRLAQLVQCESTEIYALSIW